MYRYNESTDYVVDIINVELIIPTATELAEEQKNNPLLVEAHANYLTFIANNGVVLNQELSN